MRDRRGYRVLGDTREEKGHEESRECKGESGKKVAWDHRDVRESRDHTGRPDPPDQTGRRGHADYLEKKERMGPRVPKVPVVKPDPKARKDRREIAALTARLDLRVLAARMECVE